MFDEEGRLVVRRMLAPESALLEFTRRDLPLLRIPLGTDRAHRCICRHGALRVPAATVAVLNGLRHGWASAFSLAAEPYAEEIDCPVCNGVAEMPPRHGGDFQRSRDHHGIGQVRLASEYERPKRREVVHS